MSKKLKIIILLLFAIIAASIMPGCVDQEETPLPSPTPTSFPVSPSATSTHPSTSPIPSPIASPEPSEMLKLPYAALLFEDAKIGSKKITLVHFSGDTIINAFKNDPPYWSSLEIWIGDELFQGTMTLNGAPVSANDFGVGDELKLSLDQELSDTYICIVYTPTGTILNRMTLGTPASQPTIPSTIGKPTPIPEPIETPEPEHLSISLILETSSNDQNKITLIHNGGDTIVDAFEEEPPYWNSLEIRVNGAIFTGTVKLNGAAISTGDFAPGDELEFFLNRELTTGDTITIIHVPSKELLHRFKYR